MHDWQSQGEGGEAVGVLVGRPEGACVGAALGETVGLMGGLVGIIVGSKVGLTDVGMLVGFEVRGSTQALS